MEHFPTFVGCLSSMHLPTFQKHSRLSIFKYKSDYRKTKSFTWYFKFLRSPEAVKQEKCIWKPWNEWSHWQGNMKKSNYFFIFFTYKIVLVRFKVVFFSFYFLFCNVFLQNTILYFIVIFPQWENPDYFDFIITRSL